MSILVHHCDDLGDINGTLNFLTLHFKAWSQRDFFPSLARFCFRPSVLVHCKAYKEKRICESAVVTKVYKQ